MGLSITAGQASSGQDRMHERFDALKSGAMSYVSSAMQGGLLGALMSGGRPPHTKQRAAGLDPTGPIPEGVAVAVNERFPGQAKPNLNHEAQNPSAVPTAKALGRPVARSIRGADASDLAMVGNNDGQSAWVKARDREQYERAVAGASGGSSGGSGCAPSVLTMVAASSVTVGIAAQCVRRGLAKR